MVPSSIPAVRRAIRGVTLDELRDAAAAALAERTAADARARFARFVSKG